jgi:pimeloyl-ACP methyl ester carboxylesterase
MDFRRIIILAGIGFVCALAVVVAFGQMATRATPSSVLPMAENEVEVALTAKDGVKIAASYVPSADANAPVILMLHGNGSSRSQFTGHVPWLNAHGYSAMVIDFRGHGESAAEPKSFGHFESRDAEAALRWIKRKHPQSKIGVIGVSLGGASALLGRSGPLAVDAMVLQAVYPDIDRAIRNRVTSQGHWALAAILTPLLTYQSYFRYGVWPDQISPLNSAQKYKGPVLVIGGELDSYTPVAESKALSQAFPGQRALWIMRGLEHHQVSGANSEEYAQRLLKFFDAHFDASGVGRVETAGH